MNSYLRIESSAGRYSYVTLPFLPSSYWQVHALDEHEALKEAWWLYALLTPSSSRLAALLD
eukprot:1153395-Pelagomonas_calceolata.AAC.2